VVAIVQAIGDRGIEAHAIERVDEIAHRISRQARVNDVILVMSNGAFGGLIPSLLFGLATRG
jgi:UDP-N-acetylmuramate-alanine ligase